MTSVAWPVDLTEHQRLLILEYLTRVLQVSPIGTINRRAWADGIMAEAIRNDHTPEDAIALGEGFYTLTAPASPVEPPAVVTPGHVTSATESVVLNKLQLISIESYAEHLRTLGFDVTDPTETSRRITGLALQGGYGPKAANNMGAYVYYVLLGGGSI